MTRFLVGARLGIFVVTAAFVAAAPATAQTPPGGRLTVVSGGCSVVTDQVAQTNLYYAPCNGRTVPVYDGTSVVSLDFTSGLNDTVGLTLALAGSASWAPNTLYDAFVTASRDLCTGPAYADSGAGTSARAATGGLAIAAGYPTNASNGMTCRTGASTTVSCATNQCTYVGTVLTGASAGTIDLKFGTNATNCGKAILSVYNAYNQKAVRASVSDSVQNWTYTAATWRPAHGQTNCSIDVVAGQSTDVFSAKYLQRVNPVAGGAYGAITLGLNGYATIAARAFSALFQCVGGTTACTEVLVATMDDNLAPGLNTIYAMEQSDSYHANVFNGQNSAGGIMQQQMLSYTGAM